MNQALFDILQDLPGNLSSHLQITVVPLAVGLLLSIPLSVLAVRSPRLRYPTLTAVSIVQTIPSLALLALMFPVFVAIGALLMWLADVEMTALGFYPTVTALTLYSMLPMVRNTVTGILDVDPAMTEAARGVGMTAGQTLWKVELPLALPVIIAGIRTATVWIVGIATLATPIGQRCLGDYIFPGLQTKNWTAVLFGCLFASLLAITLDLLIGGLQKAAAERRRRLALWSGGALAAVFVCGLVSPTVLGWFVRPSAPPDDAAIARDDEPALDRPVVVGSKTFTEQYILANVISDRIKKAGLETRTIQSLGSGVIFGALAAGEIDCYVDYTGTIWAVHMKREGSAAPWKVLAEVEGWLSREHGIRSLGSLGFENAYALAMRREQAETLGIESIADLARHAPDLKIGGDYEFFIRAEWKAVRDAYDLRFADRRRFDSTFMYDALVNEQVDVISAFSSDGRIDRYDLVVLDDPKNAIPPYDAIVLLGAEIADSERVAQALKPLIGSIDVKTMRQTNYMVDRAEDKQSVDQAAAWLQKQVRANADN